MLRSLPAFFETQGPVIWVQVSRTRGSTPRAVGTEMFVAAAGLWGTIGGGRLEQIAIEAAHEMLSGSDLHRDIEVPLGPEIGQCCGGHVSLRLGRMKTHDKTKACEQLDQVTAAYPHVYVLGAGHVGRALADLLQFMPVRCVLVDQRASQLAQNTAAVDTCCTPLPEAEIATAPAGSVFVVLTHDHALDFLLVSAALARGDAGYVGMIGSATKRAKCVKWVAEQDKDLDTSALVCPIGASDSRDKRPPVIAAMVLAEVMQALATAHDPPTISALAIG